MNANVLIRSGVGLLILGAAVMLIVQQRRINDLAAKNVTLLNQLESAAAAQAEHRQVIADLVRAAEQAESRLNELMRLRAQASQSQELEQELARLASELDSLRVQMEPEKPEPTVPDEDTPEWGVARAAMVFSKELGFALHAHAQTADGQMPQDLFAAVESLEPGHLDWFIENKMTEGSSFEDVKDVEFEIVYEGSLYEPTGSNPSQVIVLRQAQPLQLSNGRWARACLFGDGSSRVLVADSLDALAETEGQYTVTTP